MVEHYFSKEPTSSLRRYRIETKIRGFHLVFITASGVFSPRRIDKGTLLLAESMVIEKGWRVLDLGAGYGVLGIVAAKVADKGYVIMTEINRRAAMLARLNIKLNNLINCEVREGNLYEPVKHEKFNTIISNPPQSAGLKVCFKIISEAPSHLLRGGILQLVARHNKGGRRLMNEMEKVFGNVDVTASKWGYRVYISRLNS